MRVRLVYVSLLCLLLVWSALGIAKDHCKGNGSAVERFVCNAKTTFMLCRLQVELDVLKRVDGPAFGTCIQEYRGDVAPFYQEARATIEKRPQALGMLKDMYALWLSAMDGLVPLSGESMRTYKLRLAGLESRLNEMGHRVEIEAQ